MPRWNFDSLVREGPIVDYRVFLYPWEADDESVVDNTVFDGIKDFCDQLIDIDVIRGYRISRYNGILSEDTDLEVTSGLKEMHDDFGDWVDDEVDRIGTHLSVTNANGGGLGNSTISSSGTQAFGTSRHASVGTSDIEGNESRIANRAVHEALHTTVNNAIDEVDEMIGDVDCCSNQVNRDHFLGTLHTYAGGADRVGRASPLLGGYGRREWTNGYCSAGSSYNKIGYGTDLTVCERDAVEYTAENDL